MSVEENKAVARRYYSEVIGRGDETAIAEVLAGDYRPHMAGNPEPMDRAAVLGFLTGYRAAFPDLSDTPEEMIGEGDKLAVRGTTRGTHQGEFMGIPATGKTVAASWMAMLEFRDGTIAQVWLNFDMFGMLQQLGVIPAPAGVTAS